MSRTRILLPLLALCACTTATPTPDPPPPGEGAALCPPGVEQALRPVYAMSLDLDGQARALVLHVALSADETEWQDSEGPVFSPADEAELLQLGVRPSMDPVWILSGGAPCQMTPGPVEKVKLDYGGPRFGTFVQRLEGTCEVERTAWALQSPSSPVGCHVSAVTNVAPDAVGAMPPEAASALDPGSCREPECVLDRYFWTATTPTGAKVVELHGARYRKGEDGYADCETVEIVHGAWVQTLPDGPWHAHEVYQAHNRLIHDSRGLLAVLSSFLGAWEIRDVEGRLILGEGLDGEPWGAHRWAIHHEEDGADDLNPCGL